MMYKMSVQHEMGFGCSASQIVATKSLVEVQGGMSISLHVMRHIRTTITCVIPASWHHTNTSNWNTAT